MGLRGPKRASAAVLKARGSWRAPGRLKEEQASSKLAELEAMEAQGVPSPSNVLRLCVLRTGLDYLPKMAHQTGIPVARLQGFAEGETLDSDEMDALCDGYAVGLFRLEDWED